MVRKNVPIYRRGKTKQVNAMFLLEQFQAGIPLEAEERLLAGMLDDRLSEKERQYLSCYYLTGMTHKQIARFLHCVPSTVSKGIVRGDKKLLHIYGLVYNEK